MKDWNELSEMDQNRIVSDSISLMSTIMEVYGAEDGTSLWDRISAELGDDAKSAVLFAMLTGSSSARRRVRVLEYPRDHKVSFIKAIRVATGLGLKEAKDISEQIERGMPHIEFSIPHNRLQDLRTELYNIGVELI